MPIGGTVVRREQCCICDQHRGPCGVPIPKSMQASSTDNPAGFVDEHHDPVA